MTEMRWFHWYITDDNGVKHEHAKLQTRTQYDPTVRAGWSNAVVDHMFPTEKKLVWSEWKDVPHVWKDMQ